MEEATIAQVHQAMLSGQLSSKELLSQYMKRINAYNGTCVSGAVDPATGRQLGAATPVENAGQLNALMTLNVRGQRSKTDKVDNDPNMPDAMETAARLDAELKRTGKLVGPLHGIPIVIKDQFDTFDMRTTAGALTNYANDRPPMDATIVARLRAAGAIILAKGNMGEYASGDRSTGGGTTCNPYDTSRSAGRSSGGPAAAVSANLTMCAIGEETGPSARNPSANTSLVGIVSTHSLLSRAGLIPASATLDRPGVLCRTVADAATVLDVLKGYDPKDPATAASVGRLPTRPLLAYTMPGSLKHMRIGVIRDFMVPFSHADDDSIHIAEQALDDLRKTGATVVDPGPGNSLFTDAISELMPSIAPQHYKTLEGSGEKPTPITLRILSEYEPATTGEGLYFMNRYLANRGDQRIKNVADLIANSTFFTHPPIDGVTTPPKQRLEALMTSTRTLTDKKTGAPTTFKTPIEGLNIEGWYANRALLQAIIEKVMADNHLDALVYPTKTVPAPHLITPVEPTFLATRDDKVSVTRPEGEFIETHHVVTEARGSLTWRLSPNLGFPTITVPAGFTHEAYDRAIVVGKDGSFKAGDLVGPTPVALPVGLDFLGRAFSEPTLLQIAAAYEHTTHHRHAPPAFPALPQ
ncbi:MAG: amidase [Herbaspirillum sp.]|nr:amidase [Herbaspirillum sp.]